MPNESANLCEFLAWDSDFFGLRIARVHGHHLTPVSAHQIAKWCQTEVIDCLYFLADADDPTTTRTAEDFGYHFQDLRVTLAINIPTPSPLPIQWGGVREGTSLTTHHSPLIREVQPSDVDALAAIARTSYTDSRFYFDPCFPREKCDLLYETWVRRSCDSSGLADTVWVAEIDGLIGGYISCKCHGTIGNIGLVGVAAQARGRSIGQALVTTALTWFAERGMTSVEVITQGRNLAAQRLYQRCGLLTSDLKLWYHCWYQGCSANTL